MKRLDRRKYVRTLNQGGKRFLWHTGPTKLLLKLWLQNIEGIRSSRPNTHIHREMADKMHKYEPTHIEIKAKMDNMTKKFRKEVTKYRLTGRPSEWEYFREMEQILWQSNSFNLSLYMNEQFDFSPLDDSDSSDSADSFNNDKEEGKTITPDKSPAPEERPQSSASNERTDWSKSPERTTSEKSDSAMSANNGTPEPQKRDDTRMKSKSERLLAMAEAKLAIEREKLKVMKNISDDLSSVHREFLKAYKYKYK